MPVTAAKPAPYAPASSILDIIGRYRSRGLPTPVNADVLARAGVPGSLIPRTTQALQTLDLIDKDGAPTQTLEGLRLAPEAEYRDRMAAWLRAAYADVFGFVDPAKDGGARIRDAFRSYQPIGQQERMVSLFAGLCAAAGLMTEKPARPAPSVASNPRVQASAKRVVRERFKPPSRQDTNSTPKALPAAVTGLLASLPAEGTGWTQPRRDKFVETFGAVLDFCFPIVEREPVADETDDEAA
jgi:hypothetical protein